jgi:hypothetical protein
MRIYARDAARVDRAWERIEARMAGLPGAMRELWEEYRRSAKLADRQFFSVPGAAPLLFLPGWLNRASEPALDAIVEGTALAYWYVRIQDNVIDEPQGRGHPPLLLLSNAFLWDALDAWRTTVPAGPAWERAREAWLRFSDGTEAERRAVNDRGPYTDDAFVAHAGKVALAEVPIYMAMAAADDWRGADEVPALVHRLGVAYGLVNDVMGWERDLESRARTYLLARAAEEVGSDDEAAVRSALLRSDLLERFVARAGTEHRAALEIAGRIGMPRFAEYTEERIGDLRVLAGKIALVRLSALSAPGD